MPITKEFTVQIEDRPGTLGTLCRALADRGINIVALQAFPTGGTSTLRIVVDNPATAKTVFNAQHVNLTEIDVASVKLAHRPGELARAASKLGENNININYIYGGVESGTNAPVLIFGVQDANQAAKILESVAQKAA